MQSDIDRSEDRSDPVWIRDFNSALRELMGEELLLPAPEIAGPTTVRMIPPKEERPLERLSGSALRAAILEGVTVRRTSHLCLREVFWRGKKLGLIARSPFQPLVWASSVDRKIPFYSMTDAAVYTVAQSFGAEESCLDPLDAGADL